MLFRRSMFAVIATACTTLLSAQSPFFRSGIENILGEQRTDQSKTSAAVDSERIHPAFAELWKYPSNPNPYAKSVPGLTGDSLAKVCLVLPPERLGYLGWIRGLGCDSFGNLYACDDGYKAVWKFSPSGKLLWKIDYDSAHSSVKLSSIHGAFAVSPEGEVCIGDFMSKRLILLDSSGNVIRILPIAIRPGTVTFGRHQSLYVASWGFMYKGPYIYKYSPDGQLLERFCDRDSLSKLSDWSGNTGRLATDREGDIYFASYFPYRVFKFSPNGKLLLAINGSIPKDTLSTQAGHAFRGGSGVRGLTILANGTMAVELNLNDKVWRIDLYSPDGGFLRSIPSSALPEDFTYNYWAIDPENEFYFDIPSKTWQEIVKYKLDIPGPKL